MIRVDRAGAVAVITLDAPDRRNAIDLAGTERLADVIGELDECREVSCVVITGSGGSFSAGADLPDVGSGIGGGMQGDQAVMTAVNRLITGLVGSRLPIIAAVDGPAAGVGASIALACDLVVASDTAYFLLPFLSIGLVPDGGATLTVASSLGRARAMRMVLLGERLTSSDALKAGLIAEVCPVERFEPRVREIAQKLSEGPAVAIAKTKALINRSTIAGIDDILAREADEQVARLKSWEFLEGVAAFRERRRPRFTRPPVDSL